TQLRHLFARVVFFFSSRRRHTRSKRDWSSDVCSSDLWWGTGLRVETPCRSCDEPRLGPPRAHTVPGRQMLLNPTQTPEARLHACDSSPSEHWTCHNPTGRSAR